ncbi:facilitated trehalose transporter Tret1-like [Diprion similis]|uniref:facilitated trehalose transporter Tret1-like n=1 Tax=Diprion similis TaxID=362088 RepID=UPI001EF77972|nr:facilitated trehalose transporter Tret1-like [Diprion similis]XP_046737630.1 facilitated trehalose transporter Tret1-like [Diprion similis]XP_046737631.1 facilitated trehalose transporter Tret1-like [Diprion similis]
MEEQTPTTEVLISNGEQVVQDSGTLRPIWKDSYTQILGACIVHLLTVQAGINMAFATILTAHLKENGNDDVIQLQPGQDSLIASLVTISTPIGSLLSGRLIDEFGRRNVSMFVCIPYLISWILIYWSYNIVWLYVGRFLAGAAAGLSSVAIYYTSETTHPVWRPMLLGLTSVNVSFGILLTSVLGKWLYWRTVAVVFAAFTAVIFCLITTLPESPHWLLSFKNGTQDAHRIDQARKSLKYFNRNNAKAERELVQLLNNYRTRRVDVSMRQDETLKEKLKSFKRPEIYKPILLLLIIFFFQQNTGSYVIVFYAVELFGELGGQFGYLDAYWAMILMGAIRFVIAIIAMILSLKYGRRILCMISGLGMGLSILSASLYMHLSQFETKIPTLVFVLVFVCFSAIGWQTIPWSLTGELLPTKLRAIVGGIMTSYAYLMMFLVVLTFPALNELIEVKGAFLIYGIISFASTAFVWKYLPETFGKTLTEIEHFFK